MKVAPFTIFGITKNVPLRIVQNNEAIVSDKWDEDLWIERGEDWYALESPNLKGKKVRIIEREVWLRSKELKECKCKIPDIPMKFPHRCDRCGSYIDFTEVKGDRF